MGRFRQQRSIRSAAAAACRSGAHPSWKSDSTACALPCSLGHRLRSAQTASPGGSLRRQCAAQPLGRPRLPTTRSPAFRRLRRSPRPVPKENSSAAWGGSPRSCPAALGPAKQSLPSAHQIAMAEPAQIVLLGEADPHAKADRGHSCGHRQRAAATRSLVNASLVLGDSKSAIKSSHRDLGQRFLQFFAEKILDRVARSMVIARGRLLRTAGLSLPGTLA